MFCYLGRYLRRIFIFVKAFCFENSIKFNLLIELNADRHADYISECRDRFRVIEQFTVTELGVVIQFRSEMTLSATSVFSIHLRISEPSDALGYDNDHRDPYEYHFVWA